MSSEQLLEQVAEVAEATGVPGIAVGVLHGDQRHYAVHGVTSIDDPLPVTERTLFQICSTTKTYTATAMVRLAALGRVDLDERVRTYVPELRLQDERVAATVTVRELLNHTAGWDGGDEFIDTGEGDDALARYIDTFIDLPQRTPLGTLASYNNAAFSLAGRVIEKVTGQTYERAVGELLLEPLGLEQTLLFPVDVLDHRYAACHQEDDDGKLAVFHPWSFAPRAMAPGGRIASTIVDQLKWARFHMGDGSSLLPTELLRTMHQPSTDLELFPGVGIGLAWWLRDVDGERIVEHPGEGDGQMSTFTMVPRRDFAVVVFVNSVPNGRGAKETILRWTLETYLGVVQRDPEPIDLSQEELSPYVGTYATDAMRMDTTINGNRLNIVVELSPGGGEPPSSLLYPVGMIDAERFIVVDGPYKGLQGSFVREGDEIVSLNHIGRLAARV